MGSGAGGDRSQVDSNTEEPSTDGEHSPVSELEGEVSETDAGRDDSKGDGEAAKVGEPESENSDG